MLLSRTESKLEAARAELLQNLPGANVSRVQIHAIDGNDETAMQTYFSTLKKGYLNHLVATVRVSSNSVLALLSRGNSLHANGPC